VVGGYAVALHGHPRYTKDLDIWIEASKSNAERLIKALVEFGFDSLELSIDDFVTENQVVQLGYPPTRIDLVTSADGIDFAGSYPKRMTINIDGLPINFIDLDSLKTNKKASGRLQDLADLEALG
jgi:hypothetical protein